MEPKQGGSSFGRKSQASERADDDEEETSRTETIECHCDFDCSCDGRLPRRSSTARHSSSSPQLPASSPRSYVTHVLQSAEGGAVPFYCRCDEERRVGQQPWSLGPPIPTPQMLAVGAKQVSETEKSLRDHDEKDPAHVRSFLRSGIKLSRDEERALRQRGGRRHPEPPLEDDEAAAGRSESRATGQGSPQPHLFDPNSQSTEAVHVDTDNFRYENENFKRQERVQPKKDNVQEQRVTESPVVEHWQSTRLEAPVDVVKPEVAAVPVDKTSSEQDRAVFETQGVEGLIEEEEFNNEDCVETYGKTILGHFRKEELEREFQIHEKPRLLTTQMKVILVLMEAVIITLFTVFMYWIVHVKKSTIDIMDVFAVATTGQEDGGLGAKLELHMVIYMVIFVLLLPHVLIVSIVFEWINSNRLTAISFILKLISFCLFYGGLFDIQTAVDSNPNKAEITRDFGTHKCFSTWTVVIFVMYIIITAVKLAGHVFQRIFQIRILGSLFRIIVSDWFVDSVDHMTSGAGYIALLTGLCAYLFLARSDIHFELSLELSRSNGTVGSEDGEYAESEKDGIYIRVFGVFMTILFLMILLSNFHKHFIKNHKNFIKADVFRDVFLQFKDLYEEENVMEMGQEMPKVTSAQRML